MKGSTPDAAPMVANQASARDSNFNLGLYRPDRLWSAGEIRSLMTAAARGSPTRIDGFALLNQGEGLVGRSAGDRLQFKPAPARFGERRENVDARDLALGVAERLRRERRSGPDERV
jgi:hypothetical protein